MRPCRALERGRASEGRPDDDHVQGGVWATVKAAAVCREDKWGQGWGRAGAPTRQEEKKGVGAQQEGSQGSGAGTSMGHPGPVREAGSGDDAGSGGVLAIHRGVCTPSCRH